MRTVSFETFGCSANVADTHTLKKYAEEAGYTLGGGDSEVVVINSCTVKGPTQTTFERRVKELKEAGKKVVIAGCIPQSQPNHPVVKEHVALGPDNLSELPKALSALESDTPFHALKRKKADETLPFIPTDDPSTPLILPVSQGCLSSCSFCLTKVARGNLRSYPPRFLRDQVERGVQAGKREIYLTSQDTSAYGLDIGTDLSELVSQFIEIPGDFKIRIGMANPQHFTHFVEKLWPLFHSEKLYRFLHIPVQSGSEAVVDHMRRDHTVKDYIRLVESARSHFPDMTIATDIIAGYPTESPNDHRDSVNIIRETTPDVVNISRFWPRPNTRAARTKPLDGALVKARSAEITKTFHLASRARNRTWLNWSGSAWATEKSKYDQLILRNRSYKQIVLKNSEGKKLEFGKEHTVTVNDYGKFELWAEAK